MIKNTCVFISQRIFKKKNNYTDSFQQRVKKNVQITLLFLYRS